MAIAQLDPTQQSIAIGVGTPGPADASGRIARVAINLANWHNVPLADWLEVKPVCPQFSPTMPTVRDWQKLGWGLVVSFAIYSADARDWCRWCDYLDRKLFIGHQGTAGELSELR